MDVCTYRTCCCIILIINVRRIDLELQDNHQYYYTLPNSARIVNWLIIHVAVTVRNAFLQEMYIKPSNFSGPHLELSALQESGLSYTSLSLAVLNVLFEFTDISQNHFSLLEKVPKE